MVRVSGPESETLPEILRSQAAGHEADRHEVMAERLVDRPEQRDMHVADGAWRCSESRPDGSALGIWSR